VVLVQEVVRLFRLLVAGVLFLLGLLADSLPKEQVSERQIAALKKQLETSR